MSDDVFVHPVPFFEALAAFRRSFLWPGSTAASSIPSLGDGAATENLEAAISLLFRVPLNAGNQLELGARAATLAAAEAIRVDRADAMVTPSVTTTTTVPTVVAPSQPTGTADNVGAGTSSSAGDQATPAELPSETGPPSSEDVLAQTGEAGAP